MKPEGDRILGLSVERLTTAVAPLVGQSFGQGQIGLIGFMMTLVAHEYERGADLRATENNDIRILLSALAPAVADASLKKRVEDAAQCNETSLKISALNETNYALRRTLTELHAHVETLTGAQAKDAEQKIWTLLRKIADKRLVSLAPSP